MVSAKLLVNDENGLSVYNLYAPTEDGAIRKAYDILRRDHSWSAGYTIDTFDDAACPSCNSTVGNKCPTCDEHSF